MSIMSGEVRIRPTPLPWELVAPSTDNLHMGRSNANLVVLVGCGEAFEGVNSTMKSSETGPLTVIFGLYLMSNSLSYIAHFISLPEVFGLCNICFIGCLIGISMV